MSFFLTFSASLVSEDIRLVCNCEYEQESFSSVAIGTRGNNPEKLKCKTDLKDRTLVINLKEETFDLENHVEVRMNEPIFEKDEIYLRGQNDRYFEETKLNRINLKLTLQFGVKMPKQYKENGEWDFKNNQEWFEGVFMFEEFNYQTWQCKLVEGI